MTHPDALARDTFSEMTEITDRTISLALRRGEATAALYRDVPTAFWLADDADLPPADLTVPRQLCAAPDDVSDVRTISGQGSGMWRALLAAGPVFTATWMAVGDVLPNDHWWSAIARAAGSVMLAPLTVPIGALLGAIPIIAATMTLSAGSLSWAPLRSVWAWLATGAMLGMAISALTGADGSAGLALIATSIACAGIARRAVHWDAPEPA